MVRKAILATAFGLAALTAAWAQLSVKPGQYRVTLEMNLPGALGPQTQEALDCITAEDARDLTQAVLRELAAEDSCTSDNVKSAGNKITFDVTCDVDGTKATSNTELTVGADSYTAVMKMTIGDLVTTTRMQGQWISDSCAE